MDSLTTGNWIAIVGIAVTAILGLLGLFLKTPKSNSYTTNQKQGAFSKGKQNVSIIINNGKKDD